jgi:colanic acid/amylovoran biosynthesis glycosyltransferase
MGPEEESIRKRIEARGLGAQVSLSGPLPQHDVQRELEEAAVFAAPCVIGEDGDRDGVPTTLIEAMALGVPCVSTDVTGIPELVKHEETGLVVPQRDPKALAEAIERLLDRSGERIRLSIAGRQHVEDLFDVRKSTRELREIFRMAVAEHAGTLAAKEKAA